MRPRDPVERVAERSRDLYDVATWEPRSVLDRVAVALHRGLVAGTRAFVVFLAVAVLVGQLALVWVAATETPLLGGYILLSVLPALALAWYIWSLDVTRREPLRELVVTFALGFLFAGFAAVVNSVFAGAFGGVGVATGVPNVLLLVGFFVLVVGPVEETVKWAAVRLYAYRSDAFGAVVDGAVYGAVAGLGFATIENSLYITQQYLSAGVTAPLAATFKTTTFRMLAGPGHVFYSAIAGYYLGLAKFNGRYRGPIVVKGLLVASLVHAVYNTSVTLLPAATGAIPALADLPYGVVFLGFVVVFDGVVGYALYRKLSRYRRLYEETGAGAAADEVDGDAGVGRTEFE
ncbi:MAG: PrsW family intramembrane metalloprotease [Halobacteriaceae archaeon]